MGLFDALLNKDKQGYRTTGEYDAVTGKWIQNVTGDVKLTGSKAEVASAQDTQVATSVKEYTRPAGASQMEVYCETGYIRVRTDGQPCTATTGEPIAPGFGSGWAVDKISVFFIQESVITVVSR